MHKCMIKIFWGGQGGDTFKPPPRTNNFCLYPPPVLRCFWKDPLMTPCPHHPTSSILHCYPLLPHPPPLLPPKNFDHTLIQYKCQIWFRNSECKLAFYGATLPPPPEQLRRTQNYPVYDRVKFLTTVSSLSQLGINLSNCARGILSYLMQCSPLA